MKYLGAIRVFPKPIEELLGPLAGGGYHMCPNLVLLDGRIPPESKLLHLHIESILRSGGNISGRIYMKTLAERQGSSVRTIHRNLSRITVGGEQCAVPLIQLGGHEKVVRTFRLLPLQEVYLGPDLSEEERRRATFAPNCSFETMHGKWVASRGFTPLPLKIMHDDGLKPSARILFAIILHYISVSPSAEAHISLADLGRAMGIASRNNVRQVLRSIDSFEGGTDVTNPLVISRPVGSTGRLFRLVTAATRSEDKASVVASHVISQPPIVEVGHIRMDDPSERVHHHELTCLNVDQVNQSGSVINGRVPALNASDAVGQEQEGLPSVYDRLAQTNLDGYLATNRSETSLDLSDNIRKSQESIITRETIMRVCADWKMLAKEIGPDGVTQLMKILPDFNKLATTLDVLGYNWTGRETPANALGLVIHSYNKGIVPNRGYKPYEERWAPKPKPLIELDQMELSLDAPADFLKAWPRLSERAQKFFLMGKPRIHEQIEKDGGQSLLIEVRLANEAEFINRELRESLEIALGDLYVSVRGIENYEYKNKYEQI